MDDQFLRDLKEQPNPVFAARLRATLRTLPPNAVARVAPAAELREWFAAAASIAVVGFAFTLPPVQAGAEAFLDLFRVRQFTGVQFDPERLRSLESSGFSPEAIFGDVGAAHAAAGAGLVCDGSRRRRGRGHSRAHAGLGPERLLEHGFHGVVGTGGADHDQHRRSSGGARHARAADVELPRRSRRSNRDGACAAGRDADVRES